jgi:outer membrane cobalamin receptor
MQSKLQELTALPGRAFILAMILLCTPSVVRTQEARQDTATAASAERGQAQAAPDSQFVMPMNELVVAVTRTSQLVRDLPAKVMVLNRQVIESSSAQTLPDLLRKVPGLTLRDYQSSIAAHPTRQAPALRGLGGGTSAGRTLVLLDGVPVADAFGGWVHWARIPLEIVERVEIVRGGAAGIWGSRALGGVINIVTQRAAADGGRLLVQGGSLSTVRTDGTLTLKNNQLGLVAIGEYYHTDGFIGVQEDLRGPIDEPAGSEHGMGFASLRFDPSPAVGLRISGDYFNESRDWGTALRRAGIEAGSVRLGGDVATGSRGRASLDFFANFQTFHSTFSSETLDRTVEQPSLDQWDVPATSLGGNAQWSSGSLGIHELTAGTDVFWVDGEVNEDFLLIQGDFIRRRRVGGEQLLTGVYGQDFIRPGAGWTVLVALRWDLAHRTGGFRTVSEIPNSNILSDSTFADVTESTLNFSLGARKELSDLLSLRGSLFRAYRAPTLNELYKPFREPGNVVAESNADLQAEQTIGGEVGADMTFGSLALVRLTGFLTRVEDPIVEVTIEEAGDQSRPIVPCGFVPAGGVCRQRQNLEAFRTAGIEAEFELMPVTNWSLIGSYIWNPTEVLSAPAQPDLEGNRGSRTAEHAFTTVVRYADPRIMDASVTGRYVGPRFEDDLNSLELEDFFTLDLRFARTIARRWQLFLTVENLLDREYVTARPSSGLVRVGAPRVVLGGFRVRW